MLTLAVMVVTKTKHCLPTVSTPVSSVNILQDVAVAVVSTSVSTSSGLFVFCRARRLFLVPAFFDAVASKPMYVIEEGRKIDGWRISYQQMIYAMFFGKFKGVAYQIELLLEKTQ